MKMLMHCAARLATTAFVLGLCLTTPNALRAADPSERPLTRYAYEAPHMGGLFRIVFYSADEEAANLAAKGAFARIAALDLALSDYHPESELNRLCKASGDNRPIAVSADLFNCLEQALESSAASDGLFDPTIGPLTQLWRRSKRQKKLPEPENFAAARALVGWTLVTLDREKRTVALAKPGMRLDLGGIAKGFAADEALKVLREAGFTRAMVDAVGNVAAGDPPPDAEGWKVGVAPLDANAPPSQFLWLKNQGVATSGDAFQWVDIEGVRYSHIVDPRTGLGMTIHGATTIVARDATTADRLGSAVSLLGPEKGLALIDSLPQTAALMVRVENGEVKTYPSKNWNAAPTSEK